MTVFINSRLGRELIVASWINCIPLANACSFDACLQIQPFGYVIKLHVLTVCIRFIDFHCLLGLATLHPMSEHAIHAQHIHLVAVRAVKQWQGIVHSLATHVRIEINDDCIQRDAAFVHGVVCRAP